MTALHPPQDQRVSNSQRPHQGMNAQGYGAPQGPHDHSALQSTQNREQNSKSDYRTGCDVLISDVERSTGDWKRQQSCARRDGCPPCFRFLKTFNTQAPARQQHQENRRKVPAKDHHVKRQMRSADTGGDQFVEKGQSRMIEEKLGTERIQVRIEQLLDARSIDLSVFNSGVIPVDEQSSTSKKNKPK